MSQQDYVDSLLTAMTTIVQNANDSLEFDKTLECTIVRPVDSSTGEYKVRYLNEEISAYDDSLKMSYKKGQNVYVQVPKNDMSLKKLILGKKSIKSFDLIDATQDNEKVNTVGVPIQDIYEFDVDINGEFGTYGSTMNSYDIAFNTKDSEYNNKLFQQYAKDKKILIISADFKTNWYIPNSITGGNYGIKAVFETMDGKYVDYILNRKNMTGDSFNYISWQSNYVLLNIDGNNLKRLDEIVLFSGNFQREDDTDTSEADKDQNNPLSYEGKLFTRYKGADGKPETMEDNDAEISVKNINIQFCELIDKDGYTATINPLDGQYFEDKPTLRLQGVLKYNGSVNPIDQTKAQYYWFVKDASITIDNSEYNELAGVTWKKLDNKQQILVLNKSDFEEKSILHRKYKLVILYDDYKATSEIDIFYSLEDTSKFEIILNKSSDGRTGDLLVTPVLDGYTTQWISIDSNGQDKKEESDEPFALRNIDIANINGIKTFYCTIYLDDIAIYTISKEVSNETVIKDFNIVFNVDNNGIFYYDENGDLPQNFTTQKNISFELKSRVEGSQPFGYEYEWKLPDNINQDNLMFNINENSNMSGNQDTPDKSISFTIDRRFNRIAAEDNIIQLVIIADGEQYNFFKTLQFIKEGDPGTNGTSLIISIEQTGQNKAILVDTTNSELNYNLIMYRDGRSSYNGALVSSYFNFSYSIPNDYKLNNPLTKDNTIVTFNNNNNSFNVRVNSTGFTEQQYNSIIQIRATSNNRELFPWNVYYLLPLAQTNNITWQTYEYLGPTIVMYNESGYEGRFDETVSKLIDNNDTLIETVVTPIDDVAINDKEQIIIPPNYFDPINKSMGIKFSNADGTINYIQPIVGTLNAFSKEVLNSWDGATLTIDEDGSYVLAAQVGAGKKESDNSFTGVLMGILESKNSNLTSGTGLMGFNHGAGVFGFYDNGYAYIGGSGKGRIEFNTTNGNATIKSGNYEKTNGTEGTYIDLTEGKIDSYNFILKSRAMTLDSVNSRFTFDIAKINGDTGYFKVEDSTKKPMIYLSNTSQYIQSSDYQIATNDTAAQGLKIDLQNGSLRAPDFKIVNGNATFLGRLEAASGTFSGSLDAADGTFTGTLRGVDGTFSGSLSAATGTFGGELIANMATFGGWNINSYGIYNGTTFLYSNGNMSMKDFGVIDGDVRAKSIKFQQTVGGSSGNGGSWSHTSYLGEIGYFTTQDGTRGMAVEGNVSLAIMSGGTMKLDATGKMYFYDVDHREGLSLSQLYEGGSNVAVFG